MMGVLDWLGITMTQSAARDAGTEVVRRIASVLDRMDPAQARYLAAFAYLLGRVAHADHAVGDEEVRSMVDIVMAEGGLSPDQAALVVDLASHESFLVRGTEDFAVTQEFREVATEDQKLALLRCLFALSAADQAVVIAEDNEIRRISIELKIPHAAFIAARETVREHLAALAPGAGIRPATSER
jgi:uncharacterized tellurite resistance protein B-like protein